MELFEQLKRLFAQIVAADPSQARVDVLGPPIENWVAREPDNPNALDWLAWLKSSASYSARQTRAPMLGASCQTAWCGCFRDRWRGSIDRVCALS